MSRIVHKLKCRQLERYVKQKLKDVIRHTVDHAIRNETVFEIERRLKGNMIMVKKHIVLHATTHFKSLGLQKQEVAAFVDYYFAKHWENALRTYIEQLDDESLKCLGGIIELDEVIVYGKRKKNKPVKAKIMVSPRIHNGKFELTAVTYLGVNGYTLGYMEIKAPIYEVTGFWPYKLSSPVSISGGVSVSNPLKAAKPDIEVMAATVGKINFQVDRKVTTLQELFNGVLESTSAAALIKFTRFDARDLRTQEKVWSANTWGGGVATVGLSNSISNIHFVAAPLNVEDSIIRAVSDPTILGGQEFLKNHNIDKDSADYIEKNKMTWRLKQDIKKKK